MNQRENTPRASGVPATPPSGGFGRWTAFARWRRRFFGFIRVAAYGSCVGLVCAAAGAHVVSADLKEQALQFGRELDSMGDALGTTKTVFVNGTAMNVSNGLSDESPKEVLDRFEGICQAHPELFARALADVPEAARERAVPHGLGRLPLGVMRADAKEGRDGAVACFMDDRSFTIKDIPARLKAISAHWDLSELGRFRYVFAERVPSGKTRVRTVWVDGPFKLTEMFPKSGDSAGYDSPVVPRPPAARRLFTLSSAQVPFGIHIYASRKDETSLKDFYDEEMHSLEWKRVAKPGNESSAAYVSEAGHVVYVSFARHDGRTLVTLLETSRPNDPSMIRVRN